MTHTKHKFRTSILREYDIRGIVGDDLTADDALALGRTLGTMAVRDDIHLACAGYDGRLSSPELHHELCRGLASAGVFVMNIGLCASPELYFATKILEAGMGIMITGSHNSLEYNGFKMVYNGAPFFGEDIQNMARLSAKGNWHFGKGKIIHTESRKSYIKYLIGGHVAGGQSLKIAFDPANGALCPALKEITSKLPHRIDVINDNIDGRFPSHDPDPTVAKNMQQLQEFVLKNQCDVGIAFDGDGDRIGVVDNKGDIIWGDQLMMLYAKDILKAHPGAPIIADVKASQILFNEIEKMGGRAVMSRTGHSIIKQKMQELGAPLAGEMSGHIFFADRYFGFDDALYAALRLIEIMAKDGRPLSEIRGDFPTACNTPEIRIEVNEKEKFAHVDMIKEKLKIEGANVNDLDGVRVRENNGWWLLRASNTQNVLVLRAEADNEKSLQLIIRRMRHLLDAMNIDSTALADY